MVSWRLLCTAAAPATPRTWFIYVGLVCVCVSTANSAFEIEEKESSFEQCARLYRVIKSLFISIML